MDVSSLTKAVQDFWQFVQFPLLCVVVLFLLLRLIAPSTASKLWVKLTVLHVSDTSQIEIYKTAKRFGFDKLAPILTGFVLLLALDVLSNSVSFVGFELPPTISYSPDKLLYTHMPDRDTAMLWCNLGRPASVIELSNRVQNAANNPPENEKNAPSLRWLANDEQRAGSAYKAFCTCKFLLLFALLIAICEIRISRRWVRPLFGCLLCVAVLSVVAALYGLRFLYQTERVELSRLTVAEATVPMDSACKTLTETPQEFKDMMATGSRTRWWYLGTADLSYPQWMLVQIEELQHQD